jgi:MAP3K TRAFs-binding domain
MNKQTCFVLMPFGIKTDPNNAERKIDFDKIYKDLIKPAIETANLIPIRADEEEIGGIIHKAMFDRLLLCPYAIADLTFGNANVFYELGFRHAYKKRVTIPIREANTRLPFDLNMTDTLGYKLSEDGTIADLEETKQRIVNKIKFAQKEPHPDSPAYSLISDLTEPTVAIKSDVFQEEEEKLEAIKNTLLAIKEEYRSEIYNVEDEDKKKEILENTVGKIVELEQKIDNWEHLSIVANFIYTYRSIQAFDKMVVLIEKLPKLVRNMTIIREQYGLALGRLGQYLKAERVLKELISERGESSETYGILGRIYKQQYIDSKNDPKTFFKAKGFLKEAIKTYKKGFFTNMLDYYPGINALTLMTAQEGIDPDFKDILQFVTYTITKQIDAQSSREDYWLFATQLELAYLLQNAEMADNALTNMVRLNKAGFKVKTTLLNLDLIIEGYTNTNDLKGWEIPLRNQLARSGGEACTEG